MLLRSLFKDAYMLGFYNRTREEWVASDTVIDSNAKTFTMGERIARMMGLPDSQRKAFRIAFDCAISGATQSIWGPRCYSVSTLWSWQFEPVVLQSTILINSVTLVDDEGYVVKTRAFPVDWNFMLPGDLLQHCEMLRSRMLGLSWPKTVTLCDGTIIDVSKKAIRYAV